MKIKTAFGLLFILFLVFGAVHDTAAAAYSTQLVKTRLLDCTVVRPWDSATGPGSTQYPVIVWANGWDYPNNDTTAGYLTGLIEWALDGPYLVIAANSRSPKASDVENCLAWLVAENIRPGSDYFGIVATTNIGLAGHSQGAGVMINASDIKASYNIRGIVAMNPYAPNWRTAGIQDGPVMVLGGTADVIAPLEVYTIPAWEAIQAGGAGGLLAVLEDGDHNTDAWGPPGVDPTTTNFGNYQTITNLWWRKLLNNIADAGEPLKQILDQMPWTTEYAFTATFQLP